MVPYYVFSKDANLGSVRPFFQRSLAMAGTKINELNDKVK